MGAPAAADGMRKQRADGGLGWALRSNPKQGDTSRTEPCGRFSHRQHSSGQSGGSAPLATGSHRIGTLNRLRRANPLSQSPTRKLEALSPDFLDGDIRFGFIRETDKPFLPGIDFPLMLHSLVFDRWLRHVHPFAQASQMGQFLTAQRSQLTGLFYRLDRRAFRARRPFPQGGRQGHTRGNAEAESRTVGQYTVSWPSQSNGEKGTPRRSEGLTE